MSGTELSNEILRVSDLPHQDADWREIADFALSFNGYEYHRSFEACAEIANAHRMNTLSDARTCLFFEQRRFRHIGEDPTEEDMRYIRTVLARIRELITTDSSV